MVWMFGGRRGCMVLAVGERLAEDITPCPVTCRGRVGSHTNPEEGKYTKMNLEVHQFRLAINASNSSPLAPTLFLFDFLFSLLDFFGILKL